MPTLEQLKGPGIKSRPNTNGSSPLSAGAHASNGNHTETPVSGAAPRFTAEETILLRSLATGSTMKQIRSQLRLPPESLYRLLGDLRRKTGVVDDVALAVWVLRHMNSPDRRSQAR